MFFSCFLMFLGNYFKKLFKNISVVDSHDILHVKNVFFEHITNMKKHEKYIKKRVFSCFFHVLRLLFAQSSVTSALVLQKK